MTVRVAFQGELGAFSEEAVGLYFGAGAEPVPSKQFADVTEAVLGGVVDYGLLPIENTTVGSVLAAYDALKSGVHTVGEVVCAVRHQLLAAPGAVLTDVQRALSHPVALAQCAHFFAQHPWIEPVAVYDTAGAAKQVAEAANPAIAAVAGMRAAHRYGLSVLASGIQDRADNQTRFLVVSRTASVPHAPENASWKTALLFQTRNEPGGLVGVLAPLAERNINLTSLQARPGDEPWTYWFFIEIEGRREDPGVAHALEVIGQHVVTMIVLGSFPRSA